MRPTDAVAAVAGLATDLSAGAIGWLAGRHHGGRDVWAQPGRVHIETHGVHGPDGARIGRRVERALEQHPGVIWARVNAPTCRVVVAVTDPPPRSRELVGIVARAEAAPATEAEEVSETEFHHPAEPPRRTRLVPNLVVDVAALALAGAAKLAPWAPLPAEIAGLVSSAELHPRVRQMVAERLHGRERAESVLSMSARLAHALAAGSAGAALDIAQRVGQWREVRAGQQAWRRAEPDLIRGPDDAAATPVSSPRPTPLPEGAVERYQRRALRAGLAIAGLATPLIGLRRSIAAGLAVQPKATDSGPAAFASHLGRLMARRGALVMDRSALRRLSRLDTLVLDHAALTGDRWDLSDLIPLTGADPAEVAERSFALFDPAAPQQVRRADGWVLGPVAAIEPQVRGDTGGAQQRRLVDQGAGLVLGLARADRLAAVIAADPEPAPGLDGLLAAARAAGLRVVLATDESSPLPGYADQIVPRDDLTGAVRRLQSNGHAILLVSPQRRALGAADCGIGVHAGGSPPPWGAHVIVPRDLTVTTLLVEAVAAARHVDRDAIVLSKVAAGVGVVSAVADRHRRPAGRSLSAVNASAALALAGGAWRAHRLREHANGPVSRQPPWHLMPVELVLERLGSNPAGLDTEQVRQRMRDRDQVVAPGTSLAAAFLEELSNPLTPILAGGAALSAVLGSLVDAGLVAGVTGVSALTGAVQRVRTDRALADLLARSAVSVTVRRDGGEAVLTADQLVPGDVVALRAGDVVPADCRLLHTDGVEADESPLTGESLPVSKHPRPIVATALGDRRSMLYEGTTLATGEATAVVVATGRDSEVGRSMAAARQTQDRPTTGVQAQLGQLTRRTLPVAFGSAAAVTAAGLLHRLPPRHSLHTSASLAISSVPEGLPFLINAAQLSAARRLAERGALVRQPNTIEALGRVDVLCFDKTGTLTEGRLSVSQIHDGRQALAPVLLGRAGRAIVAAALRATPEADQPHELAHQTDRAVAECARTIGVQPTTDARGWQLVQSLPFDPERGFHATVGRHGRRRVVSVKGAPEVVLGRCHRRRTGERPGDETPLTEPDRAELIGLAEQLARAGQRVLAVAESRDGDPIPGATSHPVDGGTVRDLVFLGFLTLADPVRGGAAPAAAKLRAAGVRTVMVTGDHPATAETIAASVDPDRDLVVVTGAQLDELDDHQLDQRLPTVDVIARCSPSQKVRIIQAYQRLGRVVAMTGDGANDAPAIRLADVGIALGSRGTPAAQAAADLVVTDDRLETIIAALVEGRAMWSSVRHALALLLGGNLGEIAFTVLGATLTGRSPLNPRQLLLVNLLTDLAPAVAIALRPPNGHNVAQLLQEGPDRSLGAALNRDTAIRALATTTGAGSAWLVARLTGRHRRAATVGLAALVGAQLGQTLLTGGLDRNVVLASAGSAAVLAGVIQTPGVSGFFGCTPLGPFGWLIATSGATAGTLLGTALLRASSSAVRQAEAGDQRPA